jgi:glycosyltransferase involved in cell wall biosynthesis
MTTFTIITPTVLRETLLRTCKSVDDQSYGEWQHVVMVDRPMELLTDGQQDLLKRLAHARREVRFCPQPHKDFGNTCRKNAVDYAHGDYILYMDDDDYYLPGALEEIRKGIAGISPAPVWGVFPILRYGQIFFRIPPGPSATCNNQFFHQPRAGGRELRYPSAGYCADGEGSSEGVLRSYYHHPFNNPGDPLSWFPENGNP